jgi:hypothetical protein
VRRRRWRFTAGRGDFLPIVIGGLMASMSLPGFFLMLFVPDSNPGIFRIPLLAVLGGGALFGIGFIIVGLRVCTTPGSLAYRIARGRFLSR